MTGITVSHVGAVIVLWACLFEAVLWSMPSTMTQQEPSSTTSKEVVVSGLDDRDLMKMKEQVDQEEEKNDKVTSTNTSSYDEESAPTTPKSLKQPIIITTNTTTTTTRSEPMELPKNYTKHIPPRASWLQSPHLPYPHATIPDQIMTCPTQYDFTQYIKLRIINWGGRGPLGKHYLSKSNIWQHHVDDKLGTYVFVKSLGLDIPEIRFCTHDGVDDLKERFKGGEEGFVVKDMNGHSAHGVYVLEKGFGGLERLTQKEMSREDVWKELKERHAKDIYVEDLLSGEVEHQTPFDYKFYMFNGEVGGVAIIAHRGTERFCHTWVDENFDRIDQYGCFEPEEKESGFERDVVAAKDEDDGKEKCYPFYKGERDNRPFCHKFPAPDNWEEMVSVAKRLSRAVGIFFRIDLFSIDGRVVVGEYTPAPSKGHFHCAARPHPTMEGCIDSCYMGRMWNEGGVEGGPIVERPKFFERWGEMSVREKCTIVEAVNRNEYDFKNAKILTKKDGDSATKVNRRAKEKHHNKRHHSDKRKEKRRHLRSKDPEEVETNVLSE